ncbi:MAG: (2Fe-2S)-binding protein [Thiohalospira sp.]
MYVCICRSITDKHIEREIEAGASTLKDLNRRLGICGECGRCGKSARSVLHQKMVEKEQTGLALSPTAA